MNVVNLVEFSEQRAKGANLRGDALVRRITSLDAASADLQAHLSALAMGIVDALLVADAAALERALPALRERVAELVADGQPELRGWLLALAATSRWGIERLPAPGELALRANRQAGRFLRALEKGRGRFSAELRDELETSDSQLSRIGRDLLNNGLVVQRRIGRHALWELTPRGRQALAALDADGPSLPGAATAKPRRKHRKAAQGAPRATAAMLGQGERRRGGSGPRKRMSTARIIMPHDEGGWRIAMPSGDRRTVERFTTKREAVKRGCEIVGRAGGGTLEVHNLDGRVETKSVEPRR